jgi:uncharacterized protein YjbJ (UPF0337 family)
MIASDVLTQNWKAMRGKMRQHWKALTEDDINRAEGSVEVLVDILREKYGYSQEIAEEEVNKFVQQYAPQ